MKYENRKIVEGLISQIEVLESQLAELSEASRIEVHSKSGFELHRIQVPADPKDTPFDILLSAYASTYLTAIKREYSSEIEKLKKELEKL